MNLCNMAFLQVNRQAVHCFPYQNKSRLEILAHKFQLSSLTILRMSRTNKLGKIKQAVRNSIRKQVVKIDGRKKFGIPIAGRKQAKQCTSEKSAYQFLKFKKIDKITNNNLQTCMQVCLCTCCLLFVYKKAYFNNKLSSTN